MTTDKIQPDVDAAWLKDWHNGAAQAFESVHSRLGPQLLAFLASRCTNPEDVANEVWMRAWKNRQSFQSGNFRAWIFHIARNYLISQSRKRRPDLIGDDALSNIEETKADAESDLLAALKGCLDKLGSASVDVLRERLLGKSTEDLAAQFAITEANVAKRIWNAKTQLRECVKGKMV